MARLAGVPALARSEWPARLLLAAILFLGLWLRLRGLSFGLPAVYNPDEISIMARSLAFATGDLSPHNFLYPTFWFYVLFGWIGLYFVGARLVGAYDSLGQFQAQYFVDPSDVFLAGRLLGVAAGVATVGVTYLVTQRRYGRAAALAAALFLAVAPLHVRDSHYVKHDVPVTLAIAVALLAIDRYARPRRRASPAADAAAPRRILPMAVACGAALSIHYYAFALAAPVAYAVWQRRRRSGWRAIWTEGALATTVGLGTFFLLSPFVPLEPLTVWRDVTANRAIVIGRAFDGSTVFPSIGEYGQMLVSSTGWPILFAAAAGLGWAWRSDGGGTLRLALFPLVFLLFIVNTVPASRYLNPLLPVVAALAGYGVSRLARTVAAAHWRAGTAVLAVAAAVVPAMESYRVGSFFRQADTRTLAQQFIERESPAGSTVLVQPYTVQLRQSRAGLVEALEASLGDARRASTKSALRLALDPFPAPAYRTLFLGDGGADVDRIYVRYADLGGDQGLGALRRQRVDFIVVAWHREPHPKTRPWLDALPREADRVAVFSPYRPAVATSGPESAGPFLHNTATPIHAMLERPGPIIEIWRLR